MTPTDYSWIHQYLNLPHRDHATGPDAYDCHGLVCAVMKTQYGIDVPRHLEVDPKDRQGFARAVEVEQASGRFEQLAAPLDGTIVLMSMNDGWHHVGLWVAVNGGRVMHSYEGMGCSLDPLRKLRAMGFRRFEYWRPV